MNIDRPLTLLTNKMAQVEARHLHSTDVLLGGIRISGIRRSDYFGDLKVYVTHQLFRPEVRYEADEPVLIQVPAVSADGDLQPYVRECVNELVIRIPA